MKTIKYPELLFWSGSIAGRGFKELLIACKAGNFKRVAVSPLLISQLLDSGQDAASILDEATENGVQLFELDGVSSWAPIWFTSNVIQPIRERFNFPSEQCLDLAEAVGIKTILAAGAFDAGSIPLEELAASFANFCDAAAARNMYVELEFVPFWGIPNLQFAWDIIRLAGRSNSGILVDTWHLQMGSADFENNLTLFESIPAQHLRSIQLADAKLKPQAETLYQEGRFRLFPGDGELALERMVRILLDKGGLENIGTEIFGGAIDQLSSSEAGRRSAESIQQLLPEIRHQRELLL